MFVFFSHFWACTRITCLNFYLILYFNVLKLLTLLIIKISVIITLYMLLSSQNHCFYSVWRGFNPLQVVFHKLREFMNMCKYYVCRNIYHPYTQTRGCHFFSKTCCYSFLLMYCLIPVSYTHLDVYKRQILVIPIQ